MAMSTSTVMVEMLLSLPPVSVWFRPPIRGRRESQVFLHRQACQATLLRFWEVTSARRPFRRKPGWLSPDVERYLHSISPARHRSPQVYFTADHLHCCKGTWVCHGVTSAAEDYSVIARKRCARHDRSD